MIYGKNLLGFPQGELGNDYPAAGDQWRHEFGVRISGGMSGMSNTMLWSKREGSDWLLRGQFQIGTSSTGSAIINLPIGVVIDQSKFTPPGANTPVANVNCVGHFNMLTSATGAITPYFIVYDGSNNNQVYLAFRSSSGTYVQDDASTFIGQGLYLDITMLRIPIQGFVRQ